MEELVKQLKAKSAKGRAQLDIANYLAKFGLDAAAVIGTGNSLNLLEQDENSPMTQPLDERLRLLNTLAYVPYCMEAVRLIPSSTKEFDSWIASAVRDHAKDSEQYSSLVDYLKRGELKEEQLISDVSFFIIHGSETTKSTLTWAIFELSKQPLLISRLQKEVDKAFASTHLEKECPFLDACIKETWRLWPPIPSGLQRVTPSQGRKTSDELRLPGNVIVSVPTYTIQRDPANFSSPNEFQPTRWLLKESTAKVHQVAAFSPFGYGQDKCLGQEMALMQCRIVLTRLFQSFEISTSNNKALKAEHRDQHTIANTSCLVDIASR